MVCINLHPWLLWSSYCLGCGVNQTPMQWQGGDSFSVWLTLLILTRVWGYLAFFLKLHYFLEAQDYELILTFIEKFQTCVWGESRLDARSSEKGGKKKELKCLWSCLFNISNCGFYLILFLASLVVLDFMAYFFTYGTDWQLVPSSSLYVFIKPATLESHP